MWYLLSMKKFKTTFEITYKTKAGGNQVAHRHFVVTAANSGAALSKGEGLLKADSYYLKGKVSNSYAVAVAK